MDCQTDTTAVTWCIYEEVDSVSTLKRGDRVRIKEGYDGAGAVGFYEAKSNDTDGVVLVTFGDTVVNTLLADAIEPYPYSREERILRAIEDYADIDILITDDDRALLFAILDAGV